MAKTKFDSLPDEQTYITRLTDINNEIKDEVEKSIIDKIELTLLKRQRELILDLLKYKGVKIDEEENSQINKLIEEGLNKPEYKGPVIFKNEEGAKSDNGRTLMQQSESRSRKKHNKSTFDIGYLEVDRMPLYEDMSEDNNEYFEQLNEENKWATLEWVREGRREEWIENNERRKERRSAGRLTKKEEKEIQRANEAERNKMINERIENNIKSELGCDHVEELGLFYKVRKGKKWGIYDDIKNKFKLNIEYNEIVRIGIGYMVKKGEKRGLFDEEFNKILNVEYDSIEHIIGGYIIKKGNKYGLINNSGKKILKSEYEDIIDASSGYIVKKDGKRGAFNSSGKEIIKVEYDEIEDRGGIYKVKKGTKYGIIDKEGEKLIDIKYDDIESIGDGYKVKEQGKRGIINSNGNSTIIEAKYDEIETIGNRFKVKQNGKRGLTKSNGETLLETDYDGIEELGYKEFYIIKKDNKYGLINNKGNIKIGIHCDKIEMISPYILKRRSGGEDYYKEFVNE